MTEPPITALQVEPAPWGAVVTARGELDLSRVPELRGRLREALAHGARRLVVDLSEATTIDSVTLAAIVGVQRRLGRGGRVAVATANPYALLVLQASGLDSVVEVFATREEAQRALGAAPAR